MTCLTNPTWHEPIYRVQLNWKYRGLARKYQTSEKKHTGDKHSSLFWRDDRDEDKGSLMGLAPENFSPRFEFDSKISDKFGQTEVWISENSSKLFFRL